MALGFGDGSIGKMLAQNLSSIPRTCLKFLGVMVYPYNPSVGEAEAGRCLGLSSLTDALPARRDSVSKEADGIPKDDTHPRLSSSLCVCVHTHALSYRNMRTYIV